MVSAFQMQSFYGAPLTVDTTRAQKFFGDEEDASILDENILDHSALDSGLDMSPPTADSRRDSFAVSASLFSPKTEDWQSVDMRSVPSNNPFLNQHSNNPFMQPPQPATAAGFQGPWAVSSSGSATPLQTFDGLPSEFDTGVALFQRPAPQMQGQTPFSNPSNQVPMFQQLGHHQHPHPHPHPHPHHPSAGSQSIPASPQQKDPWMTAHQMEAKRSRPGSPLLRSHNELRRGDGIRKKNARFDIPAERNLSNIDNLIAQTTDEMEIKELKQQKRLLRNRQAALDSRQRKKQHTERLEDEKKQFSEAMTSMQDEMARLEREVGVLMRDKAGYEAYAAELEHKQADMIQQHTIETGALRKKINVLTAHIQALEGAQAPGVQVGGPQIPVVPGVHAGGFGAQDFDDMEGMAMDTPWENMQFGEFAPLEPQPQPHPQQQQQQPEIKQEMQLVPVAKKAEVSLPMPVAAEVVESNPKQGGLLFMLFLVGAFVLSSRSTPSIPRVSEDIRSMSANLLETVLKDAGVPQTASASASASISEGSIAGSSSWTPSAPTPSMPVVATMLGDNTGSMLAEMADALTQPTEQQANEQLFSLSAAQYNGVVSEAPLPQLQSRHAQYHQQQQLPRSTSQGRRNLADALANMSMRGGSGSGGGKESVSDVYTRSLLWDQIPSDVVRTFAKMVAESNAQQKKAAAAAAVGATSDGEA